MEITKESLMQLWKDCKGSPYAKLYIGIASFADESKEHNRTISISKNQDFQQPDYWLNISNEGSMDRGIGCTITFRKGKGSTYSFSFDIDFSEYYDLAGIEISLGDSPLQDAFNVVRGI